MHPELRLIEDFLTDRGALSLPALPRMLFVVRGAVTVGQRTLGHGEAFFSEEPVKANAERTGATLWRFELTDPAHETAKPLNSSARSSEKLKVPLESLPDGDLLW